MPKGSEVRVPPGPNLPAGIRLDSHGAASTKMRAWRSCHTSATCWFKSSPTPSTRSSIPSSRRSPDARHEVAVLTYELGGIACGLDLPEPMRSEVARRYEGYETDVLNRLFGVTGSFQYNFAQGR